MGLAADFDKANGGRPLQIDGKLYFENGAIRDTDPMGILISPPTNQKDLLRNQLRFQREVLRRKTVLFQQQHEALRNQATAASQTTSRLFNVVHAPQEHEIKALEDQAQEIQALQLVIAGMQQQFDDLIYPPAQRKRDEDHAAKIASAGAEAVARLQKIRV
jgi:hypothetical protein